MMAEQATIQVTGYPNVNPPVPPFANRNDDALWDWFVAAFRVARTNTARSEEALMKLLAIKMQGGDLDTYIATFNHLHMAAEWEQDSRGMILLFRRGLQPNLAQAVID